MTWANRRVLNTRHLADVECLLGVHQQLGGKAQHEELLAPGRAVGQQRLANLVLPAVGVALRQRRRIHQPQVLRRHPAAKVLKQASSNVIEKAGEAVIMSSTPVG